MKIDDKSATQLNPLSVPLCLAILVALWAILYMTNAWSLPLADPEESRCAIIANHMLQTGQWVMPYLDNLPYYNKPAPFFWLAAAGQVATGDLELGGRLVASLSALAAVLVAFSFGRALGGNSAGLLAGAALATMPEFLFLGRWYRMDMPLVAFTWLALWWYWRYEYRPIEAQKRRWRQWAGFYAFCAAATLMKGPIGLLLPVMIVAAYLLLSRQARRFLELFNPLGIAVYLAIAAPWYVAVFLQDHQYFHKFFIEQNISRYATGGFGHKKFLGIYYLPLVLGGALPWSVYLPGAAIRTFPRRLPTTPDARAGLFLWLAALLPLLFFSLSNTMLANYILPVFPPLAVLAGWTIADWAGKKDRDALYRTGARAFIVAILACLPTLLAVDYYLKNLDSWLAIPVVLAAAILVMQVRSLRADRRGQFLAWSTASLTVIFVFGIFHLAPAAYNRMSHRELGLTLLKQISPADKLCCVNAESQSFPLYAGRLFAEKINLHYPDARERLNKILNAGFVCYFLVGKDYVSDLESTTNTKFRTIAGDFSHVVVTPQK